MGEQSGEFLRGQGHGFGDGAGHCRGHGVRDHGSQQPQAGGDSGPGGQHRGSRIARGTGKQAQHASLVLVLSRHVPIRGAVQQQFNVFALRDPRLRRRQGLAQSDVDYVDVPGNQMPGTNHESGFQRAKAHGAIGRNDGWDDRSGVCINAAGQVARQHGYVLRYLRQYGAGADTGAVNGIYQQVAVFKQSGKLHRIGRSPAGTVEVFQRFGMGALAKQHGGASDTPFCQGGHCIQAITAVVSRTNEPDHSRSVQFPECSRSISTAWWARASAAMRIRRFAPPLRTSGISAVRTWEPLYTGIILTEYRLCQAHVPSIGRHMKREARSHQQIC